MEKSRRTRGNKLCWTITSNGQSGVQAEVNVVRKVAVRERCAKPLFMFAFCTRLLRCQLFSCVLRLPLFRLRMYNAVGRDSSGRLSVRSMKVYVLLYVFLFFYLFILLSLYYYLFLFCVLTSSLSVRCMFLHWCRQNGYINPFVVFVIALAYSSLFCISSIEGPLIPHTQAPIYALVANIFYINLFFIS